MSNNVETFTDLSKYVGASGCHPTLLKTKVGMGYGQMLYIGQVWEEILVAYFKAQGLEAKRPYQPELRGKALQKHQRDIDLWTPKGKCLHVEVKSRMMPFTYASVDIGSIAKYDSKQFEVAAVVVIDQATNRAGVTSGDRSGWLQRMSQELSYTVPFSQFSPLQTLVDAIKDGLYD